MAIKKAKKAASAAIIGNPAPLVYVTRDIERALGRMPGDSYFILTNSTPYSREWVEKCPDNIFFIDSGKTGKEKKGSAEPREMIDTYDLLEDGSAIIEKIKADAKAKTVNIVVFKNTKRIEELCARRKWNLLNPSAALAETIENKITQVAWLGEGSEKISKKKGSADSRDSLARYLPAHAIIKVSEIDPKSAQWKKAGITAPFMIQWAHSHTGEGTIFIGADKTGEKTLADLRKKFPDREARVTAFIQGPVFTANMCVPAQDLAQGDIAAENPEILVGNISLQITGLLPFTDNSWTTVGNDWSIPQDTLNESRIEDFRAIARDVGEHMRESGWIGLFGIDCIYDAQRDVMHLLEINARQAASTTFESQLQEKLKAQAPDHFKNQITIFEAHLAALQNSQKNAGTNANADDSEKKLIEINDGAQIILRVPGGATKESAELRKTEAEIIEIYEGLEAKNYTVIEYQNTKPNSDLLRIQSDRGIMESATKLNFRGEEIRNIVNGAENVE